MKIFTALKKGKKKKLDVITTTATGELVANVALPIPMPMLVPPPPRPGGGHRNSSKIRPDIRYSLPAAPALPRPALDASRSPKMLIMTLGREEARTATHLTPQKNSLWTWPYHPTSKRAQKSWTSPKPPAKHLHNLGAAEESCLVPEAKNWSTILVYRESDWPSAAGVDSKCWPTFQRRKPCTSPNPCKLSSPPRSLWRTHRASPAGHIQLDNYKSQGSSCYTPPKSAPASPLHSWAVPRLPPQRWKRGAMIGSGSYGCVYEGWTLDDGSFFAVKVSDSDNIPPEIHQEVAILSRLNHPNIVQYYGTTKENGSICIFLEFMKMGSLQSIMKKFRGFDEVLISSYTRQILKGLEYLHAKNTVHRGIKCANILVDSDGAR